MNTMYKIKLFSVLRQRNALKNSKTVFFNLKPNKILSNNDKYMGLHLYSFIIFK